MNILIPDSWLREYLETEATPNQIKEYLSLCGPSVERINKVGDEIVYDIEITTNRPDAMSVLGVAREAAAILPRFNLAAKLRNDPYKTKPATFKLPPATSQKLLTIETDPLLNPRWTSIVIDHVAVKPSPEWLQKKLELSGIRPINTIVDVTNWCMRAYGQPAHAFDYDTIRPTSPAGGPKNGIPLMKLRLSRKDEIVTTLDGKMHKLIGEDIVIEDGSGRLIDLCGIMGAENSSIKSETKTIVLFMQTYDPVKIRRTSMALAHRTEAAALFEKGLDPELVLPTIMKGIDLTREIAGGEVASELYDIYPNPPQLPTVAVTKAKLFAYIGKTLPDREIKQILLPLGITTTCNKSTVTVQPPSFRPDIRIDVDIIEEVARMYGYHRIQTRLPDTEPPIVVPDPELQHEENIKIRLRDLGFTQTYTYSMISEGLMDLFGLDKNHAYKISNPLSSEWVYMRPSLLPSLLTTMAENLNIRSELKLFELSMKYGYHAGDLPKENPMLVVTWSGEHFLEAKGLAQYLFSLFGIAFPPFKAQKIASHIWHPTKTMQLGIYGMVGEIHPSLLTNLKIKSPITILELDFAALVANSKPTQRYEPITKYQPVVEDLTFILPENTYAGEVIEKMKSLSPFIHTVSLQDRFENTITFRIEYIDKKKSLSAQEVEKVRTHVIMNIQHEFAAKIKGNF